MGQQVENVDIVRRQSLHAVINRACETCNAPGLFQNDVSFIEKYPEIYRPAWAGRPVGNTCPCCNSPRLPEENLGEIWSREWRTPGALKRLFKKAKSYIDSKLRRRRCL